MPSCRLDTGKAVVKTAFAQGKAEDVRQLRTKQELLRKKEELLQIRAEQLLALRASGTECLLCDASPAQAHNPKQGQAQAFIHLSTDQQAAQPTMNENLMELLVDEPLSHTWKAKQMIPTKGGRIAKLVHKWETLGEKVQAFQEHSKMAEVLSSKRAPRPLRKLHGTDGIPFAISH
ncbi:hypothetical protein WJX74_008547 [Apatococcus lobatus]|uniref:Uncharacterized protein n=1 Tax=Apatococcus lobatus TaxID=904363 RepID=A0AAW1QTT4_9CHLO